MTDGPVDWRNLQASGLPTRYEQLECYEETGQV